MQKGSTVKEVVCVALRTRALSIMTPSALCGCDLLHLVTSSIQPSQPVRPLSGRRRHSCDSGEYTGENLGQLLLLKEKLNKPVHWDSFITQQGYKDTRYNLQLYHA